MATSSISRFFVASLLIEAQPDLDDAVPSDLMNFLRPSLHRLVRACRQRGDLSGVIHRQRERLAPVAAAAAAFEIFVANLTEAMEDQQ
ncbi:hypothetical protein [Ralstonia pseudosolanacearum]|uniref:hypothetical protein n=1 Tax=Ralstonia pseudosolanacearum TaxID=1310165 RepID=UPI002004A44C|nr:hypothetical protein [Ralstonia pseudosolanacearum]MCK4155232.1 hypothetical protein [Ralstonia pseudosolanacearum]